MRDEPLGWEREFWRWLDAGGMSRERSRIRYGAGGEETTAYMFGPAGRPRRRVIAVHGAGNDALFGWIGLFKRLLELDSEILTFDLPGHGRSNRGGFSAAGAIDATRAAIDLAAGSRRTLPLHTIGVSLGGSTLVGALAGVENLASATAIVAPLRIELSVASFLGELRPANFAVLVREREHYGSTGLIPSFGPFKRDVYPLRLNAPPPPGAFGYVDALNAELTAMELERAARAVEVPTLLVYGGRDRIVPAGQGRALAARMPNATLEVIPRGSHLGTPLASETVDRVFRWIEESE